MAGDGDRAHEKLDDLRDRIGAVFDGMLEVGAPIHPAVYWEFDAICDILGIDKDRIPTERKLLADR